MIHSHTCFQGLCAVLAGAALSHADEPAVSISAFGVDKVMSGPVVSINDQYKGVVKIEMDSLTPDYATPWNTGRYQGGIGTGFLIGENAFMTNAHVVSNAERIYISMYGDSRKIPARVKFIAHDADLALLEADDPRPFKGIRPFEFSKNMPHLEDEVRVIGYPIGGNRLSVTRGVVSRIDFTTYAHPRNTEHLTIQVDAAINPGNSGGPVLMGNKVIGVAFQGLNNANNTATLRLANNGTTATGPVFGTLKANNGTAAATASRITLASSLAAGQVLEVTGGTVTLSVANGVVTAEYEATP